MNITKMLRQFINEFNQTNGVDFEIDSIRIKFSKQHKLKQLKKVGNWNKIHEKSNILHKLKKRLATNEITSAYRLENYNIYYYNSNDRPKYRKAIMVMFGLKQYHQEPPPYQIVNKIVSILKDVTNIDLCLDVSYKPNIQLLKDKFKITQYVEPTSKKLTDTYYINETFNDMIEKITIYNKALKNNLDSILWRIEAKIIIPNIRYLALPLFEFKQITDLAKVR